ncbi:uncharacterized protein LOC127841853 isoform X2 [Dreissena polymorpha]|uniref:uncharacterized protein LOC127841853 isoform X2 n=1 Tax=Dreissena polymorpha TaxID=45954 RepID=UPI002263F367|nr:uncharacterized protein LOC127841853 isoform X2 [Dreissena polymorpha]
MSTLLPRLGMPNPTAHQNKGLIGAPTGSSHQSNPSNRGRRPSLLELSINGPAFRSNDIERRYRTRSEDVAHAEKENRKRKSNIDRSKSIGHGDEKRTKTKAFNFHSLSHVDIDETIKEVTANSGASDKRVRFDSSFEESLGKPTKKQKDAGKSGLNAKNVQDRLKKSERNGGKLDPIQPTSPSQGRPPAPGSHRSRVEAARDRARIWAETYSDPGPGTEKLLKSIDNERVIRGRPVDRRGVGGDGRPPVLPGVPPRHEARPRGADKARRLQSLPSKKEDHVSQVDDRTVTSAPSKEHPPTEVPLPKVNNLISKEDTPGASDRKPSPERQKPNATPAPTMRPKEHKEDRTLPPAVETSKPTDRGAERHGERVVVKPAPATGADNTKASEERDRKPAQLPGVAGRSTQEEDRKRIEKFTGSEVSDGTNASTNKYRPTRTHLPSDDHGPSGVHTLPAVSIDPEPRRKSPEPDIRQKVAMDLKRKEAALKEKQLEEEKEDRRVRERQTSPRRDKHVDVLPMRNPSNKTENSVVARKSEKSSVNTAAPSNKSNKSKTSVEISLYPAGEMSDRKRREVTIMDPKAMQKYSEESENEIDDEAFMHEYEYKHNVDTTEKTFNEMTDEEKIEYFRDTLKMRPEQIRELTFHPRVTEPKTIHRAYTGVETGNWRSSRRTLALRPKSRKVNVYKKVRTLAPAQRKAYVHSRLQGVVYRHINEVYGASPREEREKRFFEKLTKVQMDELQHRYEMLADREQRKFEAKLRQRDQLKRLRNKFEEDSWRRFMTQYVTRKVVEAEYKNREDYGLPSDLRRMSLHTNLSPNSRHQYTLTPRRRQKMNVKKFSNLFRYNVGPEYRPSGKPLKFEGFDTVYIDTEDENGKPKKKKKTNVAALMREAQRILDQSDNDDTDIEEPEVRERPKERRHYHSRPHHRRSRDVHHVRDDKSSVTVTTTKSSVRNTRKQPPKTIKDLISQRKNRYQATSFSAMKEDLLKDSVSLNKSEQLRKFSDNNSNINKYSPKLSDSGYSSKQIDSAASSSIARPVDRGMRTPPDSPVPAPSRSHVSKTYVTTTVVQTTQKSETPKEIDVTSTVSRWKVDAGNVFLDHAETQMALDTARDKKYHDIKNAKQPSRAPSRISKASVRHDTTVVTESTTKEHTRDTKPRAPSRFSVKDPPSNQDAQQRSRAPSRNEGVVKNVTSTTTEITSTSTTTVTPLNTSNTSQLQRKPSRTSIVPSETTPKPTISTGSQQTFRQEPSPSSGSVFLTQTVESGDPTADKSKQQNGMTDDSKLRHQSPVHASQETPNRDGRTSVVAGSQYMKTSNIPVSRDTPMVPKVSPENNKTPEKTTESSINGTRSKSPEKPTKPVMNGHASPTRRDPNDHRDASQPKVTKSINVSENIVERHIDRNNRDVSKNVHPGKVRKAPVKSGETHLDMQHNDLLSTRKFDLHDRTKQNETPKLKRKRVSGADKKTTRSSRTPTRNGNEANGDITMRREDYENQVQPKRPQRKTSKSPSNRKRSTSRGRGDRKRSLSRDRQRKRYVSKERRKSTRTPSRFPDIENGTRVSVNRNVKEDVHETEKSVTPKPENRWRDLVNKYTRQPSPKIGKTDDRSLLDANLESDDDDEDIFTRMTKRYNLRVNSDSEEDV